MLSGGLPTVVIDAGHGGNDEGAKSKGVLEKSLTLDMAFRLEAALHKRGFATVLTRNYDHYVALSQRVMVANLLEGPAVFVSIHFNQGSEGNINGIETFYASIKTPPARDWTWIGFFGPSREVDSGEDLAASIQSTVIAKTGARDRGIRGRDLYVTRNTRVPAVLIEGGFLTNTMESHLLQDEDYANRLAEGIAEGIDLWSQALPKKGPVPLAKAR